MSKLLRVTAATAALSGCAEQMRDSGVDDAGTPTVFGDSTSSATGHSTTGEHPPASGTSHSSEGAADATSGDVDDSAGTCTPFCRMDVQTPRDVVPEECGGVTVDLELAPPNVMLVLDRSGSMWDQTWDGDADAATPEVTQWSSLHRVVETITTQFETVMNLGATLFPSGDSTSRCEVSADPDVPIGPLHGALIMGTIPPRDSPPIPGRTPTLKGLQTAFNHLAGLDPAVARAAILVTDGAPTCADSNEKVEVEVASAAMQHGIATYVVGVAIPQTPLLRDGFNAVARAGGHPAPGPDDFFDVRDETELLLTLREIVGGIVSCTIDLNPLPSNPARVRVVLDGATVPPAGNCESDDGWVYTGEEKDRIQLCGTWCDAAATASSIEALYGCPPQG